ncbi:hypothetical protein HDU92_005045 [Lobulomyces angularis]|nr:hypothetical protein HDU92_005045 [Lobulomyces angularis]
MYNLISKQSWYQYYLNVFPEIPLVFDPAISFHQKYKTSLKVLNKFGNPKSGGNKRDCCHTDDEYVKIDDFQNYLVIAFEPNQDLLHKSVDVHTFGYTYFDEKDLTTTTVFANLNFTLGKTKKYSLKNDKPVLLMHFSILSDLYVLSANDVVEDYCDTIYFHSYKNKEHIYSTYSHDSFNIYNVYKYYCKAKSPSILYGGNSRREDCVILHGTSTEITEEFIFCIFDFVQCKSLAMFSFPKQYYFSKCDPERSWFITSSTEKSNMIKVWEFNTMECLFSVDLGDVGFFTEGGLSKSPEYWKSETSFTQNSSKINQPLVFASVSQSKNKIGLWDLENFYQLSAKEKEEKRDYTLAHKLSNVALEELSKESDQYEFVTITKNSVEVTTQNDGVFYFNSIAKTENLVFTSKIFNCKLLEYNFTNPLQDNDFRSNFFDFFVLDPIVILMFDHCK